MSYRLEAMESIPDGLRRIAAEELSSAMHLLDDGCAEERDKRIHEARKSMKKLRALLRLARGALSPATYRGENRCIRDTGRLLSRLRASAANLEAFEVLVSDVPPNADREAVAEARRRLLQVYANQGGDAKAALNEAAAELAGALGRVAEWELEGDGWSVLEPGLQAIYARGRHAYREARKQCTAEAFHDWRKQVKYLWYSVRLLEPCWPKPLKALASELAALAEILGDEHDLAELEHLLQPQPLAKTDAGDLPSQPTQSPFLDQLGPAPGALRLSTGRTPDARQPVRQADDPVTSLIAERRSVLHAAAYRSGKRLYAERPRHFTRRLGTYFQAWRKDTKGERPAPASGGTPKSDVDSRRRDEATGPSVPAQEQTT